MNFAKYSNEFHNCHYTNPHMIHSSCIMPKREILLSNSVKVEAAAKYHTVPIYDHPRLEQY